MSSSFRHEQLYCLLKKRIGNGFYPPGFKFPPEVVLAKEFSVSRNTLRLALRQLEAEYLVVRISSKGTFVMPYCENISTARRLLVLCQRDNNYYYPCHYILPGMVREAAIRDIELEICDLTFLSNFTPERLKLYLESAHISGIMVIASHFESGDRLIDLLNSQSVPVLQVHGRPGDYNITNWALLYIHTQRAWSAALRILAECGHKHVVTTNFITENKEVRRWPRSEYIALLQELGLDSSEKLILDFPSFDHTALREMLCELFSNSRRRPTAVMAFSDHQAPTIYSALQSLNLHIPEDVAVMGFCGIPDSEYMDPPLSTINMNFQLMGAKAIAIMTTSDDWYPKAQAKQGKLPLVEHEFTVTLRESHARSIHKKG